MRGMLERLIETDEINYQPCFKERFHSVEFFATHLSREASQIRDLGSYGVSIEGSAAYAQAGLEALMAVKRITISSSVAIRFPDPKLNSDVAPLRERLNDFGFRVFGIDACDQRWLLSLEPNVRISGLYALRLPEPPQAISVLLHSGDSNGAVHSHIDMTRALRRRGHLIHTVLPSPNDQVVRRLVDAGSSVTAVSSVPCWVSRCSTRSEVSTRFRLDDSSEAITALLKSLPDMIMTQSSITPVGALAALVGGVPHIWWIREFGDLDHDLVFPFKNVEIGAFIEKTASFTLVNSRAVQQHFGLGASPKVKISRPFISKDTVVSNFDYPRADMAHLNVGVVASFQPGKGHLLALRALHELILKSVPIRLHFYGRSDHRDLVRLLGYIKEMSLEKAVVFHGSKSAPHEIYPELDVVVIPSVSEAFGRVTIEAMAFGKPVVYADAGGLPEYMSDGVTGIAIDPRDHHSLVRALMTLRDRTRRLDIVESAADQLPRRLGEEQQIIVVTDAIRDAGMNHEENPDAAGSAPSAVTNWFLKKSIMADLDTFELMTAIAERDLTLRVVYNSRSWRMTRPMRRIANLARDILVQKGAS
jgi:glycosyltransferase involved in cell wall biosynthesis